MKPTPITRGQLDGMASHVVYEVEMLVLTCRELLARGVDEIPHFGVPSVADVEADRLLNNVLVESFLIHARSLDDFLAFTGGKRKPDDVFAIDYIQSWVPGEVLTKDVRDVINKRVAHLTINRLRFLVGVQPSEISRWLLSSFRDFVDTLPPEHWPALHRAASTALHHLNYLDGLQLPNLVACTTTQSVMLTMPGASPYFTYESRRTFRPHSL